MRLANGHLAATVGSITYSRGRVNVPGESLTRTNKKNQPGSSPRNFEAEAKVSTGSRVSIADMLPVVKTMHILKLSTQHIAFATKI